MPEDRGQTNAVVAELLAIKRLLILALSRAGAPQDEIAVALGVNQSTISRMFPKPAAPKRKKARR